MSRPRVIGETIASGDGKVQLAPDVPKSEDKPQVILEGSSSFVADDEEPEPLPLFEGDPKILYQDFLPDAAIHRPGHQVIQFSFYEKINTVQI
jgi:hypothetical protein